MDDESYFSLDGTKSQPRYYYSYNGENISKTSSERPQGKFSKKLMVWISISEKGISDPVIFKENTCIDAVVYKEKSLPKVEKCHKNDYTLFWPDLVTSHYAISNKKI